MTSVIPKAIDEPLRGSIVRVATDAIETSNHMQRPVPAVELLAVCRAGQERDELGPRDLDERERP
jgi:hypothetical protein